MYSITPRTKLAQQATVFVGVLLMYLSPPTAVAASPIISEIYPSPATGEPEWIELYNPDATSVDISGFQLYDLLLSPSLITTFASGELLAPGQYRQVTLTSAKLNNSGDGVTLKSAAGTLIDEVSFGSTPTGTSWQRVALDTSELTSITSPTPGAAHQTYSLALPATPQPTVAPTPNPTPTPTPGATATPVPSATPLPTPSPSPSSTPTPTPSPTPTSSPSPSLSPTPTPLITASQSASTIDLSQLKLSEIMACPATGGLEWLELYFTGTSALELKNWVVQDAAANKKYISATLSPNSYTQLSWTGSLLNNSGDTLTLITPEGLQVITTTFTECETGLSLVFAALTGTSFDWLSATPTPGQKNAVPLATSAVTTTGTASLLTTASGQASSTVSNGISGTLSNSSLLTDSPSFSLTTPRAALPQPSTKVLWKNYSVETLNRSLLAADHFSPSLTPAATTAANLVSAPPKNPLIPSRHAILAGILLFVSAVSSATYVYPHHFTSLLTRVSSYTHPFAAS